MREVERELWVVEGISVHGLKPELLEKVRQRHQLIDSVPAAGYFYPDLFMPPANSDLAKPLEKVKSEIVEKEQIFRIEYFSQKGGEMDDSTGED